MIPLISEQDKVQLKEYALELLTAESFKGLAIMLEFFKDEAPEIKNRERTLKRAAELGYLVIVKHLVEQGTNIHMNDDAALRFAARKGHVEIVRYLVENGANIHAREKYCLRWAIENKHIEVVRYLKEAFKNDPSHQYC